MTDEHCPLGGECKFIDDLWAEMRYVKKKQADEIRCIKKREGDFASMYLFKILITILIIVFGGLFSLGWSIKNDIASVDKSVAINSQRMIAIEKQLDADDRH